MKAYVQEYYAVGYIMETYCIDCLPSYVDIISDNCQEILPDSEWDYVPICCVCDKEHMYMKITKKGMKRRRTADSKKNKKYQTLKTLGFLEVTLHGLIKPAVLIELDLIPKYYGWVLSMFCFLYQEGYRKYLYGTDIEKVKKAFSKYESIIRILEVMIRWNNNDAHPACIHQRKLDWEEGKEATPWMPKNYYSLMRKECPEYGYKFASATRYEELPKEVVDEVMKWCQ